MIWYSRWLRLVLVSSDGVAAVEAVADGGSEMAVSAFDDDKSVARNSIADSTARLSTESELEDAIGEKRPPEDEVEAVTVVSRLLELGVVEGVSAVPE